MQLALTVRDLGPEDLTDLEWSGGSEHLNAVAEALKIGRASCRERV